LLAELSMTSPPRASGLLLALVAVAACSGRPLHPTPAAADADATPDTREAGLPVDRQDHDVADAPRDLAFLDGPIACGDRTCNAGEICLAQESGLAEHPARRYCTAPPSACAGVPSCECFVDASVVAGCSARYNCWPLGDDGRHFECGGL
jgi:hypothetical protein